MKKNLHKLDKIIDKVLKYKPKEQPEYYEIKLDEELKNILIKNRNNPKFVLCDPRELKNLETKKTVYLPPIPKEIWEKWI